MRKIVLFGFIAIILFLSACSSSGGGAAATVKNMYKAALNHDAETFTKLVSEDVLDYGDVEDAMEELRETVNEIGGIDEMMVVELDKKKLNSEMVEYFNEDYNNNWSFVAQDIKGDEYLCWILVKGDKFHQIMYVEDLSEDEFMAKK